MKNQKAIAYPTSGLQKKYTGIFSFYRNNRQFSVYQKGNRHKNGLIFLDKIFYKC